MVLLGDGGLINGTLIRLHVIDKPIPLMYNVFGGDRRHGANYPAVHGSVVDRLSSAISILHLKRQHGALEHHAG